jgi:tripartite-type tricarboxylate transporter receptor subunit TctC
MTTGQKPGLRRFAATLLATAASAFAMGSAHAAYPDKPVRIVVGFSAGGTTDVIARIMAKELTESLGQSFVVENKPGAGSNIATDQVKRADPDGYTLLFVAVTSAINQTLYKNVNFDLTKDFTPVALGAKVPNILVVNPQVPVKSVQELVDYAKKNPGKLNYGSGGNGSAGHLSGELLKARAGINVEHIPYQGAAPAQLALLSGQSDFMFDNLAASAPLIKDGKVKALAVTTAKRSSLLADVPTVEESGVKGFDLGTWFGVFTTGGTPAPVVAKLNKAYSEAMQQPDVKQRLLTMGSEAAPMSSEAFAEFVKNEKAKYQEIVKISGASLN